MQFVLLGFCLKCYSDVHSQEMELCEERKGFRTCFIKYDHGKKTSYWWIQVVCLFHKFYYVTIYPVSIILKINFSDGFVTGRGCATQEQ